LLAGDALLTQAFNVLAELNVQPERIVKVLGLLGTSAGSLGMVGGQVLDLESENHKISPELMKTIHSKKTGALFNVSVVGAAILAGVDNEKLHALQDYAENIGVAFQIVDDILDVIGDENLIGKPVGSDERNQKATYPALFGLEKSRQLAEEAIANSLEALAIFGEKAEALQCIAKFILSRDH
jgi:geranylgeranyl diphosphate synthase type II